MFTCVPYPSRQAPGGTGAQGAAGNYSDARHDPSVDMIVVFMHQCALSTSRKVGGRKA